MKLSVFLVKPKYVLLFVRGRYNTGYYDCHYPHGSVKAVDSTACHHCLTGCSVPFLSCLHGLASYSPLHACNAYIAIYDLFSALAFKPLRIQHLQCDWMHAIPGGTVQWLHADYQIHREQEQSEEVWHCVLCSPGWKCMIRCPLGKTVAMECGAIYIFICSVCTNKQANLAIFTLL